MRRFVLCLLAAAPAASPGGAVDFDRDVRPILAARCLDCHGPKKQKGGLRLDLPEGVQRTKSEILPRVTGDEGRMPPSGPRLTAKEIDLLRAWITDGAKMPGAATHWAYRPLSRPAVPGSVGANPIDAFVQARLDAARLRPAPPADRRSLLRRLSFDLLGLPPTPRDVEAFERDSRPGAYERVVDRLLASPAYGERWARHWLDVVHFAETHGHDQDVPRENAWPYRDYLIRAFNDDRSWSRMIEEQVAGDILYPDSPEGVVATGMLAAGPWDESSQQSIRDDTLDKKQAQNLDRDDVVTTVFSAFASTTVHCARCHHHKFDPVSQAEYYGLQAVFSGIDKANRPYDPDAAEGRRRRELVSRLAKATSFRELAGAIRGLVELPPPAVVYAAASRFEPVSSFRPAKGCRPVHVLGRGEITKPLTPAAPVALSFLPELPSKLAIDRPDDEGSRRAALARWLADRRNALTWRSMANRVWHYHFGKGLASPGDLGKMGTPPSHPDLLDWLAAELRDSGSLKSLHRLIVTSDAYRRAVRHDAEAAKVDADNALLWRGNRHRLDAESLRDAVLAVSGKLDRAMGGPSVKQFVMSKGLHVTPNVDYAGLDVDAPGMHRRAVYRFVFRTLPDPLLDALDCPDASQFTPARSSSITALQALALLNDRFLVRQAEHFADRLRREAGEGTEPCIRLAYELALNRPATDREVASLSEYARKHGLAAACRVLLNCNEFVFVD